MKSDGFVDKTLFIKEVIEDYSKAILITRPRRCGKTLNMSMLKNYLEIEVDINGKIKPYKRNPGYFQRLNKSNNKPLKIMSVAIDNKKIVDFLLKNFEKKQIFKLDDLEEINSLITDLEDTVYPEWLEIKDSILNKKRIDLSYTEAEINKLEKLCRIYCDEILNKFCELNSSIQETIDKNIEYQSALQKLNIDYGILSTEKKNSQIILMKISEQN